MELRFQIIVSTITFRKGFAKFMILIALFKQSLSYHFIASVEVSSMAMYRCSSKSDELRNINSIGCRARNINIQIWEIDNLKIKIVTLIVILVETTPLEIDKCKSKNAAWVSKVLILLSWSSEGYI